MNANIELPNETWQVLSELINYIETYRFNLFNFTSFRKYKQNSIKWLSGIPSNDVETVFGIMNNMILNCNFKDLLEIEKVVEYVNSASATKYLTEWTLPLLSERKNQIILELIKENEILKVWKSKLIIEAIDLTNLKTKELLEN